MRLVQIIHFQADYLDLTKTAKTADPWPGLNIINISTSLQGLNVTTKNLPRSTFHWLSCENLHRASSSGVNLIVHHVLEPLIVGWSKEHLRVQLTSSESIVQNLRAILASTHRAARIAHYCIPRSL